MEKRSYHTEGRQRLLNFLCQHPDCQFTADEICTAIRQDGGKSSIYRQLDELCQADAVRKFPDSEKRGNVYQYVGKECDCKTHFHAKCLSCGKMEHLDCSDSMSFSEHLMREHGFAVDCGQSILWGICAECRAKEVKNERSCNNVGVAD